MIERSKKVKSNLGRVTLIFILINAITIVLSLLQYRRDGAMDIYDIGMNVLALYFSFFAVAKSTYQLVNLRVFYHPDDLREENYKTTLPLHIESSNCSIPIHSCLVVQEHIDIRNADADELVEDISLRHECKDRLYPTETPCNVDILFWLSKQDQTACIVRGSVNIILRYTIDGKGKKETFNLPIEFVL